jgi:cytochrome c-type biogenesis protein CcmH
MISRALRNTCFVLAAALLIAAPAPGQLPGQSERAQRIGKRMLCMCGCNQVLTECNHVGCTVSTSMLQELDERISRGDSDDLILQSFIQQYGQKVLTEPPARGFGLAGWLAPFAALLGGTLIVRAVLLRWRRQPSLATGGAPVKVSADFLAQAQRETDLDDEFSAPAQEHAEQAKAPPDGNR